MARILKYPDYQVAAGHNNEVGLESWENLIGDGETRYMLPPLGRGGFNPGQTIIRGNDREYLAGHRSMAIQFSWVRYAEDVMLQEDYCGAFGSYDGLVTVRLRLSVAVDFANYNATLHLPKPNERDEAVGRINNYLIRFTRLDEIPAP